uniref:Solute carrier family 23 member 1 n=1 Tax=Ditylenchus dipsaci TaxID=166011 RepID=A0A915D1A0_9BILA
MMMQFNNNYTTSNREDDDDDEISCSSNDGGTGLIEERGGGIKKPSPPPFSHWINGTDKRKFYRADDDPPWPLAVLFGFQQVMVCVSALLVIPFILADELCPGADINDLRVRLISSTFVASGISTIIQTVFGMRLALLQGTAFAYVPSVHAFMTLGEYNAMLLSPTLSPRRCLLLSACVPMLIGVSGLVGRLTKFIGPITSSCVWTGLKSIGLTHTSCYFICHNSLLGRIESADTGNERWQIPLYLIAILFSWGFCWMLTVTDLVDPSSEARTDKNATITAIQEADWFRVPYPGQFGAPQFNGGLFAAFLVSALTSVFESVGDYHAIARVSGSGSFISGLIGPGVGLTTHTENIGVIGVTQVASRRTLVIAGFILIFLGVFTKVGALLSTIPTPLVGGVLASSMAMVGGVAIANVQSVDLKCSRNIAILGFSIIIGVIVPTYYTRHQAKISFGNQTIDQIVKVLMNLPMFVGAATACILDNTVPGATREQRGLRPRGAQHDLGVDGRDIYLLPKPVMSVIEWMGTYKFGKILISILPIIPKPKKIDKVYNSTSTDFLDGQLPPR